MTDLRKAAEAVLEAWAWDWSEPRNEALKERMEALRQALAMENFSEVNQEIEEALKQTEQKGHCTCGNPTILGYVHFRTRPCIYYTAPPKRGWVGLTDEEIDKTMVGYPIDYKHEFAQAIEAKLKEKNGGNQ